MSGVLLRTRARDVRIVNNTCWTNGRLGLLPGESHGVCVLRDGVWTRIYSSKDFEAVKDFAATLIGPVAS